MKLMALSIGMLKGKNDVVPKIFMPGVDFCLNIKGFLLPMASAAVAKLL